MPTKRVKFPDGTIHTVSVPDGATNEQILEFVSSQYASPKANFGDVSATVDRAPAKPKSKLRDAAHWVVKQNIGAVDGLTQRLMDFPVGLAQTVGNVVNHNVQVGATALDRITGSGPTMSGLITGDNRGRFARSDWVEGVGRRNAANNAQVAKREADYQARTEGNLGASAGGAVGMVAPAVVGVGALRAASLLPKVTSTMGKVGLLAGEGAAMAAAQPVTQEGEYWGGWGGKAA